MWKIIGWGLIIYFFANVTVSIFESVTGVGIASVYELSCLGDTKDIYKCTKNGGRIYARKRRFKVDFNHQRVVEDDGILSAWKGCNVFDSDNWFCLSQDESYYQSMKDGSFTDSYYYDNKTQVVLKEDTLMIYYWYYYWKGFFR